MTTLDEVIKEYENLAKYHTDPFSNGKRHYANKIMAENFRRLAEWLSELKVYKERMPSYEAGYNDAKRGIALSGEYERVYERGKADAQTGRWIPVSERLPSENGCYLVSTTGTNNDIIDIAYYTKEIWHKASRIKAWMPLPEPYRAESEDNENVHQV